MTLERAVRVCEHRSFPLVLAVWMLLRGQSGLEETICVEIHKRKCHFLQMCRQLFPLPGLILRLRQPRKKVKHVVKYAPTASFRSYTALALCPPGMLVTSVPHVPQNKGSLNSRAQQQRCCLGSRPTVHPGPCSAKKGCGLRSLGAAHLWMQPMLIRQESKISTAPHSGMTLPSSGCFEHELFSNPESLFVFCIPLAFRGKGNVHSREINTRRLSPGVKISAWTSNGPRRRVTLSEIVWFCCVHKAFLRLLKTRDSQ